MSRLQWIHAPKPTDSRMIGNVETANLAIVESAVFMGEIHIPKRQKETISFVEKRKK